MPENDLLAERFEAHRDHLRGVAYRMLGSVNEADDAVQESWLRLQRSGEEIAHLGGWLTTVVSRVCLDLLRSRAARHDDPAGWELPEPVAAGPDPEGEAIMAESVGRALLVVLDRLAPAERIAFVLQDLFAVPFEEIAPIVGRTPGAAKKLASRARSRVRGVSVLPEVDLVWHREVVEAFLAAARGRDLDGLLAVLDPAVVRTADPAALPPGTPVEIHGAREVVEETVLLAERAVFAEIALIDGRPGVVVAPHGRLLLALTLTIANGRITGYTVVADPLRLRALTISL